MKYKYLLMDNDGTLMDFKRAQAQALETAWRAEIPKPYSGEILEVYAACNDSWWSKLERGACTKAQLQLGRFEDLFEKTGVTASAEAMNQSYMEALGRGRFLIDGAVEVLKKLSQSYRIYIITNGVSKTQYSRITKCGFAPYISGIFVSEETGFAKPAAEYFRYVMNKIGDGDRKNYLVVGDSLSSDILGAKNIGMDAVWFNPHGAKMQASLPVVGEISALSQLEKLLL